MAWDIGDIPGNTNATISAEYLMGPIPLPPSVWLFGTGLLGLWGLRRKFKS